MQDVNNDMDNLFRKAAEQYPLKTDGADWQKVFAGLQDTSVPAEEKKEKRKRRLLWLFLLLPLALLCGVYHNRSYAPLQQAMNTKQAGIDTLQNNNQLSEFTHSESFSEKKEGDSEKSSASTDKVKTAPVFRINSQSNEQLPLYKNNRNESYKEEIKNSTSLQPGISENNTENFTQKQTADSKNILKDGYKKNEFILQPSISTDRIDKTEVSDSVKQETIGGAIQKSNDSLVLYSNKKDSTVSTHDENHNSKNKLVKTKPRIQTGFYAGLLASFDVSTVKLQRINKTGYGFELLLGYRFSKRVSVESGINRTDKNYYSVGKYFDKSRTDISPQSNIIFTNGTCAMFEVPAVVKYDFAQKKRNTWFATAGLSSYIMKDEKYTYYAIHSGMPYTATKKYKNSGTNLFSVASLSVGYQLQVSKHLSLRAEPYIKMPLSGIGIAKMPITSTGITAGFTRSF